MDEKDIIRDALLLYADAEGYAGIDHIEIAVPGEPLWDTWAREDFSASHAVKTMFGFADSAVIALRAYGAGGFYRSVESAMLDLDKYFLPQKRRRLRWTTTIPTQPGYYWVEFALGDDQITFWIVDCQLYKEPWWAIHKSGELMVHLGEELFMISDDRFLRWSDAPIPAPEE